MGTYRRGRPPGSKTFAETPAVKRAAEYLDLLRAGERPAAAARAVAAEWQVDESTVFHDLKRHTQRLAEKWATEARQMDAEARRLNIECGRRLLEDRPDIAEALATMLQAEAGPPLAGLAARLESLGNPVAAKATKDYTWRTVASSDLWLEILGLFYLELLKTARKGV